MPSLRFSSPATVFALLLLLTPSTAVLLPRPSVAQTSASQEFDLPESVTSGTTVRIDGSDSMRRINQVLQQRFENAYSGTEVQAAYSGTEAALAALTAGDIDLAAIGRPLTEAEKAQGLTEVPIERHKIALIVAPSNPFTGSITTTQFAEIFRGEVTNWSQLGGESEPIRLVDRPEASDTRQAFRAYPVFKSSPFTTGDTAEAVSDDSTVDVIANLGDTGIGYAIAEQVFDDADVRILAMHDTLPDDPRYPFSQPLAYVYRGTPSPAVQAFLGYATAPQNADALEDARVDSAIASMDGPDAGAPIANAAANVATAANGTTLPGEVTADDASPADPEGDEADPAAGAADNSGAAVDSPEASPDDSALIRTATAPDGSAPDSNTLGGDATAGEAEVDDANPWPWWWLLLLLLLPLLLFLLLRRKGDSAAAPVAADDELDAVPPATAGVAPPMTDSAAMAAADLVASPAVEPTIDPDRSVAVPPAVVDPTAGTAAGGNPEVTDANAGVDLDTTESATGPVGMGLGMAAGAGLGAAAGAATSGNSDGVDGAATADVAADAAVADSALDSGTAFPKSTVVLPVVPLVPLSNDIGSRVVMTAPTPQTLRAQWDIADVDSSPEAESQLALRLHDITGLAPDSRPHRTWQFLCLESDPALEIEVPDPEATYEGEIGYVTPTGRWLGLARSLPISPSGAIGTAGLAAAGLAAAGVGAAELAPDPASSAPLEPTPTQLSLTPQLSSTLQADWTLSPQDTARLSAHDGPLLLRLYDATVGPVDGIGPLAGQYHCELGQTSIQVPVAEGDRDYVGELGYLATDDQWVPFARSEKIRLIRPTTDDVAGTVTGVAVASEAETNLDAVAAAAAAAAVAATAAPRASEHEPEPIVEPVVAEPVIAEPVAAAPDLGKSQITLMVDGQAAAAHWTLSNSDREALRTAGRDRLELRVHDVTGIDLNHQTSLGTQTYWVDATATTQVVTVPVGDRDYLAELGYLDTARGWTILARSLHSHIPSSNPAVQAPGRVETDSPAQTPPPEGLPKTAIAVGLGAVAASAASLDDTAARYATVTTPGISQIILVPHDAQYAYAYWEVAEEQHDQLRAQGGKQFQLRVHDATGLDIDYQPPHHTQTFDCQPADCDRHVPIPQRDRDYIAEVGYTTDDGGWLRIIRSFHTWIPQ